MLAATHPRIPPLDSECHLELILRLLGFQALHQHLQRWMCVCCGQNCHVAHHLVRGPALHRPVFISFWKSATFVTRVFLIRSLRDVRLLCKCLSRIVLGGMTAMLRRLLRLLAGLCRPHTSGALPRIAICPARRVGRLCKSTCYPAAHLCGNAPCRQHLCTQARTGSSARTQLKWKTREANIHKPLRRRWPARPGHPPGWSHAWDNRACKTVLCLLGHLRMIKKAKKALTSFDNRELDTAPEDVCLHPPCSWWWRISNPSSLCVISL